MKTLLALTQLKTFLNFFQGVFKTNLKSEDEFVNYDKSDSIIIEGDNITMRIKLIVRGYIPAMTFRQKSFFSSILGLPPHWNYIRPDEYFGEKIINLN